MIAGNFFHSDREMKLEKVNNKNWGAFCLGSILGFFFVFHWVHFVM